MCETESIDEVIPVVVICKCKSRSHDKIFIRIDAKKSSLANCIRESPCVAEAGIGALPTQTQLLYFKMSFLTSTSEISMVILTSAI